MILYIELFSQTLHRAEPEHPVYTSTYTVCLYFTHTLGYIPIKATALRFIFQKKLQKLFFEFAFLLLRFVVLEQKKKKLCIVKLQLHRPTSFEALFFLARWTMAGKKGATPGEGSSEGAGSFGFIGGTLSPLSPVPAAPSSDAARSLKKLAALCGTDAISPAPAPFQA